MNRVSVVFVVSLLAAVIVSLLVPPREGSLRIAFDGISYRTSAAFNLAAAGVIAFLIRVYALWW
jgi:SSS family solute:Na+ symporter